MCVFFADFWDLIPNVRKVYCRTQLYALSVEHRVNIYIKHGDSFTTK